MTNLEAGRMHLALCLMITTQLWNYSLYSSMRRGSGLYDQKYPCRPSGCYKGQGPLRLYIEPEPRKPEQREGRESELVITACRDFDL